MIGRSQRWVVAVALTAIALAGGVGLWRGLRPKPAVAPAAADVDDEPVAPANPGYLGPHACAECHADRVAEFLKTRHAIACVEPSPSTVTPAFNSQPRPHRGLNSPFTLTMSHAGDDYQVTITGPAESGEQRSTAKIGLVYGSRGVSDEMYFTWHGDKLYELPMAWLYPQHDWGNSTLNPHGSGDFARETDPRCLECHNTWFAHVPGTQNQYRRDDAILGVTCERCHGPGREHVAFHKANPQSRAAQAIVQPKRLERERLIEVCTQCHSNATKYRTAAFSYRPGEPLERSFYTIVTQRVEDDHVANQVQYLRRSKCFQNSDMTCVTCHNPHKPTDHAAVQRSCLKCHEPAACKDHDRQPIAVQSNCTGCHMPGRVWMNVHFHTKDDEFVPPVRRHDHRIAVHPEARKTVLLEWYETQSDSASKAEAARLRKELVEHWLAEAEKRRRDYRLVEVIGALREALRIDPTPAIRAQIAEAVQADRQLNSAVNDAVFLTNQKRYPEAFAKFREALALKPNLGLAHAQFGKALLQAGESEKAAEEFKLAVTYDGTDAYPHVKLGWLAFGNERFAEALEQARRADAVEPYSAEIKYLMAQSLLRLNRLPEATAELRKAIEIDPRHAGALQSLAHALRKQGQAAEAVELAKKSARLTKYDNADVLLTLADCYLDAGQIGDAEDAATKALAAAQQRERGLVPKARRRLEEIKSRRR